MSRAASTSDAPVKRAAPLRLAVVPPVDPPEEWHQRNIIVLAALHEKQWPDLSWLCHVPNGGLRSDGQGAKLKLQGVRPGYEDLLLDVPRRNPETGGEFRGWRGELKRYRTGKPSAEQEDWLAFHRSQGYRAEWHKGDKAMWADLWWYLHLPRVCPAPLPRLIRLTPPKPKTTRKQPVQKQTKLLY